MTQNLSRRAALAAAATLTACSVLPSRPYQERREWPLEVAPAPVASPPGSPVLLLRDTEAAPGLDSRGLRTLRADGSEHLDDWEEWAVPPSQAVSTALREWLAAGGLFTAVVTPGSDLTANLILEPELLAFVADQQTGRARVTISVVLIHPGRRAPIMQRVLTGEAPLGGSDGASLAQALKSALVVVLGQIQTALAPVVRT